MGRFPQYCSRLDISPAPREVVRPELAARVEALHGKLDALHWKLDAQDEKLDAVPALIRFLFTAVYEKLDAVPRLMRSLFAAGREKLDASRLGRGGNQARRHHGAGATENTMQRANALWRSGGDEPGAQP